MASSFDATDMVKIHTGIIRPTPGPGGMPSIVRARYTLEGQIRDAFEKEGRTSLNGGWRDYSSEPIYAAHKLGKNAGQKVGIWDGSKRPLRDTFLNQSNPDHVETITSRGFSYGSRRGYAGTFHEGGVLQPWDKILQPGRVIVVVNDQFALEVARGHQRYIVGKLREQGTDISTIRIIL